MSVMGPRVGHRPARADVAELTFVTPRCSGYVFNGAGSLRGGHGCERAVGDDDGASSVGQDHLDDLVDDIADDVGVFDVFGEDEAVDGGRSGLGTRSSPRPR